ncbi:unnamed protein product [Darwinula stevensoni]|uniref:Peptidase S1 domain-containing protein n=1 Tax=Darwinula stevensoni TaxID=69355 RepID=A0A7R9A5C6_9CRUS|nr:unnamed protein product [Darwinula stevensoni]CAG0895327.1 unnamed protein product [Darwinula stevensoni]
MRILTPRTFLPKVPIVLLNSLINTLITLLTLMATLMTTLMTTLKVSRIFLHEDFNRQNFDSDIALLELAEDATLTERVQLVCLPEHSDISDTSSKSGLLGSVAGWGSDDTGVLPNVLMEVELPILSNRECRKDTIHFTGDQHVTSDQIGGVIFRLSQPLQMRSEGEMVHGGYYDVKGGQHHCCRHPM